jgi:hypothetical protein
MVPAHGSATENMNFCPRVTLETIRNIVVALSINVQIDATLPIPRVPACLSHRPIGSPTPHCFRPLNRRGGGSNTLLRVRGLGEPIRTIRWKAWHSTLRVLHISYSVIHFHPGFSQKVRRFNIEQFFKTLDTTKKRYFL